MAIKTALATAHPFEGLHLRVAQEYQRDRLGMSKTEKRQAVTSLFLASYFAACGFDGEPLMTPQEAFSEAMAHVGIAVDSTKHAPSLEAAASSAVRYGFDVDGEAVSAIDLYRQPRFGSTEERCSVIAQKILARSDILTEIPRY